MIYAKSDPVESLREHTDGLLKESDLLKRAYGEKIESLIEDRALFWKLVDIAIEFHDLGKVFTPFQNVIRDKIRETTLDTTLQNTINHNFLSPAFIDFKALELKDAQIKKILLQAIAYHHERGIEISKEWMEEVQYAIKEDIEGKVSQIEEEFAVRYPIKKKGLNNSYLQKLKQRITPDDEDYFLYIMLKGLLHKLDHAASAHEPIEIDFDQNVGEATEKFIIQEHSKLRDVQEFAKENREKNMLLIASTGMGKTETALIWIDSDKAYFTLPLRVSINALFDRVAEKNEKGINFPYAGLLHSTSVDYLEEKEYEAAEELVDLSKLMSTKLTFSTIDQIFKFPFMFRGYEKIYATLAYSKVVIDEIQAYSPEIAAVLIKGLEMLHRIGGQFMIMTATMPTLYIDEMKKRGLMDEEMVVRTFNTKQKRHHIQIREEGIGQNLEAIVQSAKVKKVLIIVNTVKDAVSLYESVQEVVGDEVVCINLLHSMYTVEDRSCLEEQIKAFAKSEEKGIWITTQLVEASLDIDFDELHTQISTLDSLFQRLGRCNRKGGKSTRFPNVFIYTEEVSGIGSIYDEVIVKNGLMLLKEAMDDAETLLISEDCKMDLVARLYAKEMLEGTKYYKKFRDALKILDAMEPGFLTGNQAQAILREIESVTAIPRVIYDQIRDELIEVYEEVGKQLDRAYEKLDKVLINKLKKERREIKRKILKKTVNVPKYKAGKNITPTGIKGLDELFILEYEYEVSKEDEQLKGRGVLIGQELSQFV